MAEWTSGQQPPGVSTPDVVDAGVQHEEDPAQGLAVRHHGRPATGFGPGSGGNGSMSGHSSSGTIHGRD
ncbi:hypothetical protein GCM10019016_103980 [Streptomyces prasinosporus]|uniref:Uncharacterized protein n=1 Tax=Streptomyces prasinosporus TaxID=68256 RepID=A0ABP6U986_9ACTN